MQPHSFAILILAVGAPLMAQPAPHTTTSPAVFAGQRLSLNGNFLPHARTGGKVQVWQRGDSFSLGQVILAVGVRPFGVVGSATTQSMEILFDNATVGFSGLTSTFANNLTVAQTVVFARRTINLPAVLTPDPEVPIVWMPLDTPWVFLGPNFLAQFDLGSAVNALTTVHVAYVYSMYTATETLHTQSHLSCGGRLTADYDTNFARYRLSLDGVTPNGFVLYMIGANNRRFAGSVPLPLLLDSVGMVGCYLGLDPLLYIPAVADGLGGNIRLVPFIVPSTDTTILYAQALHASGGALGIGTSNLANSVMGGVGLGNIVYNWTADGPIAQDGPFRTSLGPVLLFQP